MATELGASFGQAVHGYRSADLINQTSYNLSPHASPIETLSSRDGSGDCIEEEPSTQTTGYARNKSFATANTKNRAAQKRYRERQKGKMETYKQQVDDLSRRLDELQTENGSLEKRNRLLEQVVKMKTQLPSASGTTQISVGEIGQSIFEADSDTHTAVADYMNAVRDQKQPLLTPQDAAKVSPEDLRQVRLEYLRQLASLLLIHDESKEADGQNALEQYVLRTRLASIRVLNSMSVRSFAQILAMKKRMSLNGTISEKIMAALKLSPDQKRDYLTARRQLLARNDAIKEERRQIVSELELAVPDMAPLMCGQTAAMLRACESSDRFKESLEDEHRSMVQFHLDCFQVLMPVQEARSLLVAHPGSPDPWLITGYIDAEQRGCLQEWLYLHSPQSAGGEPGAPPSAGPSPSNSATADASLFLAAAGNLGDLNALPICTEAPIKTEFEEQGAWQPLQSNPSEFQDLMSAPSIDGLDPGLLDGLATDDMWIDFFPGLLSHSQQ